MTEDNDHVHDEIDRLGLDELRVWAHAIEDQRRSWRHRALAAEERPVNTEDTTPYETAFPVRACPHTLSWFAGGICGECGGTKPVSTSTREPETAVVMRGAIALQAMEAAFARLRESGVDLRLVLEAEHAALNAISKRPDPVARRALRSERGE